MKVSDNRYFQEDIENAAKSASVDWDALKGKGVFVTGATGLLGSQIVMTLLMANEQKDLGLTVYALVRSEEKAKTVFANVLGESLVFVKGDVMKPFELDADIDFVIHAANPTSSKFFVEHPVETITTTVCGTRKMLQLAYEKNVSSFVFLSSLEVYGIPSAEDGRVTEKDYGYIDPMSVRSSYSEGKRMAETMCVAYASQYGVPVKVARLCQSLGSGVDYNDGRVFAQFARAAIEGTDIVLKTDGSTERNYSYISDAVAGILTVLTKGETAQAYNIANEASGITIKDLALLFCNEFSEGRSKLVFDIAEDATKLGYNPKMKILLDTSKLRALGWEPQVGLKETFQRLVESMKLDRKA
ncbi:MAG: NAD-dependent epimerase/dehydratase family protein [Ruminococcus sp.]|nr:NAD-dependent epimerase/dehydratase family protein [Ruminococcus sp.]MBQ7071230.1 NAD-dependent epimerase/dehydratase family protein [Ruminococcus sp.]